MLLFTDKMTFYVVFLQNLIKMEPPNGNFLFLRLIIFTTYDNFFAVFYT